LRRFLYDVDVFEALRDFLVSKDTRSLRRRAVDALAETLTARWDSRLERGYGSERTAPAWGPRSSAASKTWGEWSREQPYRLPEAALRSSKQAWRLVLLRQLQFMLWPPWRFPVRATLGLAQLVAGATALGLVGFLRAVAAVVRRRRLRRLLGGGAPARGGSGSADGFEASVEVIGVDDV